MNPIKSIAGVGYIKNVNRHAETPVTTAIATRSTFFLLIKNGIVKKIPNIIIIFRKLYATKLCDEIQDI